MIWLKEANRYAKFRVHKTKFPPRCMIRIASRVRAKQQMMARRIDCDATLGHLPTHGSWWILQWQTNCICEALTNTGNGNLKANTCWRCCSYGSLESVQIKFAWTFCWFTYIRRIKARFFFAMTLPRVLGRQQRVTREQIHVLSYCHNLNRTNWCSMHLSLGCCGIICNIKF